MFTPGFKLFAGVATFGLFGSFIYGLSSSDVDGPDYFGFVDRDAIIGLISLGWRGAIGGAETGAQSGVIVLLFMFVTAGLLGGTVVAFRDADVESVAELGDTPSVMPLAQRPTTPSIWPAATAIGLGILLIGLVLDTKAFWIIGLVVLSAVAIEWALSAWADRSTGDDRTNSILRDRMAASFEIPLAGVAIGAAVALSISRIFIWATGLGAVLIAVIASLIIAAIAIMAVLMPNLGRKTMNGIVGLVAVVVIALGILTSFAEPRGGSHGPGEEETSEVEAE